jgi:undecaprenyl-diphosphatase
VTYVAPPTEGHRLALIAAFDDAVDRQVEKIRGDWLDHVAYPLSSAADHSLIWHAAGAIRAFRSEDLKYAARFGAAMGIESFVTNVAVKSLFGRLRPERSSDEPMRYGLRQPITSSFPSGHATAAFCAATILARGSRLPSGWYVLAAAVASTRVYVKLHHTSDVIAGAAFGVVLGRLLRRLVLPEETR